MGDIAGCKFFQQKNGRGRKSEPRDVTNLLGSLPYPDAQLVYCSRLEEANVIFEDLDRVYV